ncbi:hypothetical protein KJ564_14430 [bacterium]|nr:hypothetical protein [bacterium]
MKKLIISLLVIINLTILCNAVMVDGFAYLGGQSNHGGIEVFFEADSPSAVTDSVFTDEVGYYDIDLIPGFYDIYFSFENYLTEEILDQNCFGSVSLDTVILYRELNGTISGIIDGHFIVTVYVVKVFRTVLLFS